MKSILATTVILAGAALITGCKSDDASMHASHNGVSMGVVNSRCACGATVDPDVHTATLNGQKVGFCSNDCAAAWNKLSTEKQQQFVQVNTEGNY
ncbi:MAG: hypothetical protein KC983_06395 [Phycisphaerales bacterium]|nr:hypothetical protein [Phycisphaerales bacterium]